MCCLLLFFFFQAEDGIRDVAVTGVQTCALPILNGSAQIVRDKSLNAKLKLGIQSNDEAITKDGRIDRKSVV